MLLVLYLDARNTSFWSQYVFCSLTQRRGVFEQCIVKCEALAQWGWGSRNVGEITEKKRKVYKMILSLSCLVTLEN